MLEALIILFSVGLLLLIMSFFMHNRLSELEKDVEQMNVNHAQEVYMMKNKLRIIEEELLSDSLQYDQLSRKPVEKSKTDKSKRYGEPNIVQKVKQLNKEGFNVSEIEEKTGLAESDVKIIIQQQENNHSFG
ncbi:hypothetical protein [Halalkalibacillus halophilus]|uniref:hypothetical protein n=1 Tax=Halalkalibacillus halophilus TaxID=392827 RepID=UPI0004019BA8|nr:hypothetical protein [Halalkalibacillus halophilus]